VLAEPDPASPAAGSPTRKPVVVLSWPYQKSDSVTSPVPVPSVTGRSVREAALALHRRGLRMNLHGLGRVVRTAPAAGESAPQGVSVTVWAE
jgi:beta-lactam-binding protein with PASTA domain